MIDIASSEKGFTLVEVIVSIALIGILSMPINTLTLYNIKLNKHTKDRIIATNLAENKIEKLKFQEDIRIQKETKNSRGFIIKSSIETVERKDIAEEDEETIALADLYKLVVEIKKDNKVIERLITYRSSVERVD